MQKKLNNQWIPESKQYGIHTYDMKVFIGTKQYQKLRDVIPGNLCHPDGLSNPFDIPGIHKLSIIKKATGFGYYVTLVIEPQALIEEGPTLNLFNCSLDSMQTLLSKLQDLLPSISPILELHKRDWYLSRVDYAIQAKFDNTELYVELAKRSAVPYNYRPKYDGMHSSYTQCKSICHNFYYKYEQLLSRNASQALIDASKGLYRTEIQILCTDKLKDLREKFNISDRMFGLFKAEIALEVLKNYYIKHVSLCAYNNYSVAIQKIQQAKKHARTKEWLIEMVDFLAACSSYDEAKQKIRYQNTDIPRRYQNAYKPEISIKQLRDDVREHLRPLDINPIIIPNDFEIDFLPNPYQFFFN